MIDNLGKDGLPKRSNHQRSRRKRIFGPDHSSGKLVNFRFPELWSGPDDRLPTMSTAGLSVRVDVGIVTDDMCYAL